MSYIGNPPAEAYTNTVKDTFSGDGTTTAFTLSLPTTTNNVRVVVENVIQDPTVAYGVSGTTLTFTSAPPSGTNNIYVVHLGPAVQTVQPPSDLSGNFTLTGDLTQTGDYTLTGGLTATTLSGDGSALTGVGKVLQVVEATDDTNTITSSSTFIDTSLSASITPTSNTSKIFVIATGGFDNNSGGNQGYATIDRNGTNLGNGTFGFGLIFSPSRIIVPWAASILDTPATTSTLTYKIQVRASSGTIEFPGGTGRKVITLMEIAG